MDKCMHLFHKYLLNDYDGPGTALEARCIAVNKVPASFQ